MISSRCVDIVQKCSPVGECWLWKSELMTFRDVAVLLNCPELCKLRNVNVTNLTILQVFEVDCYFVFDIVFFIYSLRSVTV